MKRNAFIYNKEKVLKASFLVVQQLNMSSCFFVCVFFVCVSHPNYEHGYMNLSQTRPNLTKLYQAK